MGNDRFELCCIPFFLYGVALGDVITASPRAGKQYVLDKVVEPSGRYVCRVSFADSCWPRDEIASELKGLGSLLEWSSLNLLAVDAADLEHGQMIASFLTEHQNAGHLVYERGRS